MSLSEVELKAKAFSESRDELAAAIALLNAAVAAVHVAHLPRIRKLVVAAASRELELEALIEINRAHFSSPKTQIFSGIKCGLAKLKGGLTWEDEAQVCRLIRKHFPDQIDQLMKVEETPLKNGLKSLDPSDLAKLGCAVEEKGDVIVIRPISDAVDKAVNALLKAATSLDAQEQEAA